MGGQIVAVGTPEELAAVPGSYTGRFLADLVEPAKSGKDSKLSVAA
jgi:excinuclease ABC subunit A